MEVGFGRVFIKKKGGGGKWWGYQNHCEQKQ